MKYDDVICRKNSIIANILLYSMTFLGVGGIAFYAVYFKDFLQILWFILYLIASLLIAIPLHELGHLIGGKISGMEFVSYQVLFFVWIKKNGKIKFQFRMPHLIGQCIMSVKDGKYDQTHLTGHYMMGGSRTNFILMVLSLIVAIIAFVLWNIILFPLIAFFFINAYLVISNMIPLNLKGIYNDGLNNKLMKKYEDAENVIKDLFILQKMAFNDKTIEEMELFMKNYPSLPYYFIHSFPYDQYWFMLKVHKKEENSFTYWMKWFNNRHVLPILYLVQTSIFLAYRRIMFDEEYEYLFQMKENRKYLNRKYESADVEMLFVLKDYKEGLIDQNRALNLLDLIAEPKDRGETASENELFLGLKDMVTLYIKGEYPPKPEPVINEEAQNEDESNT